jgi:hypothetical protein
MAQKIDIPSTSAPKTGAPLDKDPNDLGNGDYLIATLGNNPKHIAKIIKRTDPSQYIPYLMRCSCGTEGRFDKEEDARGFADYHLTRHIRG